ncbi:MAG: hypothetical protein ABI585_01585 [Betaproteobacteria bacterium]
MSRADLSSIPAPRMAWWAIALLFAIAFSIALAGAVALNAGARLRASPSTIVVPASAMTLVRGEGRATPQGIQLEATGADGVGWVVAPDSDLDADAYSRVVWRFAVAPPGRLGLAMTWMRRDRPGTVYSAEIEWSRGDARIDLTRHRDWIGPVHGLGLVFRGRLPAPLVVADASLRSNAWEATLDDIVGEWWGARGTERRETKTSLRDESDQIAPLLPVVAAALAFAVAFVVWRGRRRGVAPDLGTIVAIVIAGWLVVDLRWQTLLWFGHASAWSEFAGRTLDDKHAADRDAPIFAVARRVRDADRPRGGRVLVLSDSTPLATRVAWFLYPDNVWVESRRGGRAAPLRPDALRKGDQVVLLLKRGLAWDAARGKLVWPDGSSREARAILADGPDFALLEIQ